MQSNNDSLDNETVSIPSRGIILIVENTDSWEECKDCFRSIIDNATMQKWFTPQQTHDNGAVRYGWAHALPFSEYIFEMDVNQLVNLNSTVAHDLGIRAIEVDPAMFTGNSTLSI